MIHRLEAYAVGAIADDPETLDDVGEINNNGDHVEDEAATVKEHVALTGLVKLHDQPHQAHREHDVQDPLDQIRRIVQELEMGLDGVKVGRRRDGCTP